MRQGSTYALLKRTCSSFSCLYWRSAKATHKVFQ